MPSLASKGAKKRQIALMFRLSSGRLAMTPMLVKQLSDNQVERGAQHPLHALEARDLIEEGASAVQWMGEAVRHDQGYARRIRPAEAVRDLARAVDEFNAWSRAREHLAPRDDAGRFAPSSSWLSGLPRIAKAWRQDRMSF